MNTSALLAPGKYKVFSKGETQELRCYNSMIICLWDSKNHYGGVCHLPTSGLASDIKNFKPLITLFLKDIKRLGCEIKTIQIKVIGGSQGEHLVLNSILNEYNLSIFRAAIGNGATKQVRFDSKSGSLEFKTISENSVCLSNSNKQIKVLIVDDSAAIRMTIKKMLSMDPQIQVVGEACDAIEGEKLKDSLKPDVITLDINMPKIDGVTFLKKYMSTSPTPTIIVTDYNLKETGPVMAALESGAFDYFQKPSLEDLKGASEILNSKIKAAANTNIKLLSKRLLSPHSHIRGLSDGVNSESVIAIGASTGGTEAIKELLLTLPSHIPPILIVQHMPPGFTRSFAERLNELCDFEVKEAENGEVIKPGVVYIAPGGFQMGLKEMGRELRIHITDAPPENRFKPSVDYLFRDLRKVKNRKKTAAILTGMGADGARELLQLKKQGTLTVAQNEESCVVFGMPKAAIEMGAACKIEPLERIGEVLLFSLEQKAA